MIYIKNGLPLVRGTNGIAIAFDVEWLRVTLMAAALRAGYHSWWQGDDLVEVIHLYLQRSYKGSVIDLRNLEQVVRTVLRDVGYDEVATCFQTGRACYRISLVQCVRELSHSNRGEFFSGLAECIYRLSPSSTSQVHFSDLRACVRELRKMYSAPTGHGDDHELLHEIVTFLRTRILFFTSRREFLCSIY